MNEKKRDPWTDPDPQPGDFDDFLDEMEWTQVIVGPELEKELESDDEAARRRALVNSPDSAEPAKPARR
jgi:hypothetical protein